MLSEAGLVMISPVQHVACAHLRPRRQRESRLPPRLFPHDNNDLYQGQAVADFAYNELGLRRMAGLDDGDPYTTALVSAFVDAYQALGGEVVATERIEKRTEDMTVDGIFFPIFSRRLCLRRAGAGVRWPGRRDADLGCGPLRVEIPQYTAVGRRVHGRVGFRLERHGARRDEAIYGGSPVSPYWAHAYDATTLLLSAISSVAMEVGGSCT